MKTELKKRLQKAVAGTMAAAGLALLAGCAADVYPAPGGEVAYYDYDYYPDVNVYFYPHDRVYYWNDHDHWRSGRYLPNRYHLDAGHRQQLHLHSRQPWVDRR